MSQFSGLAQGDGLGEWANILIVIVMALFWVVGGLAKSLTRNKGQRQGGKPPSKRPSPPAQGQRRQTWLQQVARKAEELQKAAAQRMQEIERQAQGKPGPGSKRPQTPARSVPAGARAARTEAPSHGPKSPPPVTEPVPFYDAKPKPVSAMAQVDLSDPDALRTAILHYEILGKPLAMRDPFE